MLLYTGKAAEYKTPEEEAKRKEIFMKNLEYILEHQKLFEQGLKSYQLGVNEYSDMVSQLEYTINKKLVKVSRT